VRRLQLEATQQTKLAHPSTIQSTHNSLSGKTPHDTDGRPSSTCGAESTPAPTVCLSHSATYQSKLGGPIQTLWPPPKRHQPTVGGAVHIYGGRCGAHLRWAVRCSCNAMRSNHQIQSQPQHLREGLYRGNTGRTVVGCNRKQGEDRRRVQPQTRGGPSSGATANKGRTVVGCNRLDCSVPCYVIFNIWDGRFGRDLMRC
jgi:hypothetical protein